MLEAFEQQSYHLHAETLLSQGIDYLKAFPELDEYTIEAADGHFIDHACHTEKNSKGKVYAAGGDLRVESQKWVAQISLSGDKRNSEDIKKYLCYEIILKSKTREITALRNISMSTIKPSPTLSGGIGRNRHANYMISMLSG
ncbi:hypothetical protein [Bathymodiolus japonicus methanotrophic gill symbiont]|uniref:hypothetical protein n=1 Tax=Bathymodiolus japonicus methanotrophic gill symbiont TaxID=113269 RepID=UPI001C8EC681|nr:hypothetical protein [Bathymodiolus japonicus methanotrophic gill symbiont]